MPTTPPIQPSAAATAAAFIGAGQQARGPVQGSLAPIVSTFIGIELIHRIAELTDDIFIFGHWFFGLRRNDFLQRRLRRRTASIDKLRNGLAVIVRNGLESGYAEPGDHANRCAKHQGADHKGSLVLSRHGPTNAGIPGKAETCLRHGFVFDTSYAARQMETIEGETPEAYQPLHRLTAPSGDLLNVQFLSLP